MTRTRQLVLFAATIALAVPIHGQGNNEDTSVESKLASAAFGAAPVAPTIEVYTRETIVDVTVTDARGNPIRGLTRNDFTISEDKKPQPTRGFSESDVATASAPAPLQPIAPTVHSNDRPAAIGVGPANIILIDALHSNFANVARCISAVDGFISRMRPGTPVALFSLTQGGLHMMQGLTADPALLHEALDQTITEVGADQPPYITNWSVVEALDQIAAYVASIPGRKNLFWLTPDMVVHLTRDGGWEWPDVDDMTIVHRLMDTYERFTAEQVAVSPVDSTGVAPMKTYLPKEVEVSERMLEAEEVAEQSGGIAVHNTNDLATGIADAVDRLSSYYTLSYIPPRSKPDGHYHTIQVTTNIPGAKLLYRVGYDSENVKPIPKYAGASLLRAAIEGRAPAATELHFHAKLEVAADQSPLATMPAAPKVHGKANRQRVLYDLDFTVPQDQIAAGDTPDGLRTINIEFALAAYNLMGRSLSNTTQNISRTFTPEQYDIFLQNPLVFHQQVAFYPGPLFLRVGVLDYTSNHAGTIEIPVKVHPGAGQAPPERIAPAPCPPRCPLPQSIR